LTIVELHVIICAFIVAGTAAQKADYLACRWSFEAQDACEGAPIERSGGNAVALLPRRVILLLGDPPFVGGRERVYT
jgi:hypothetical protein